jgi:hypothetical protein
MAPFFDYRIGAGENMALLSLINIESIKPTNDRNFYAPMAYGFSAPGVRRGRLDGVGFRSGFTHVVWYFKVATRAQYEYLSTTYCAGGYSGKVTIYTTTGKSSYARYNAVIDIPATEETQGGEFFAFVGGLRVTFSHLVAL